MTKSLLTQLEELIEHYRRKIATGISYNGSDLEVWAGIVNELREQRAALKAKIKEIEEKSYWDNNGETNVAVSLRNIRKILGRLD